MIEHIKSESGMTFCINSHLILPMILCRPSLNGGPVLLGDLSLTELILILHTCAFSENLS